MYKPDTAILMSIQPKWCELIANGIKTVEVRKTIPKLDAPFKVYMYCTQTAINGDIVLARSEEIRTLFPNKQVVGINRGFAAKEDFSLRGKVFGEFVCDKITEFSPILDLKDLNSVHLEICEKSCVNMRDLYSYANGKTLCAWHISDLVIYDKPKELKEFSKPCICTDEYEGEIYCNCLHCDLAGDSDYGIVPCDRKLSRPPQSWCYVEDRGDMQ